MTSYVLASRFAAPQARAREHGRLQKAQYKGRLTSSKSCLSGKRSLWSLTHQRTTMRCQRRQTLLVVQRKDMNAGMAAEVVGKMDA
eukprot:9406032-Pyramimonas_sp.AAC.1